MSALWKPGETYTVVKEPNVIKSSARMLPSPHWATDSGKMPQPVLLARAATTTLGDEQSI
jgi:hypothetical protein